MTVLGFDRTGIGGGPHDGVHYEDLHVKVCMAHDGTVSNAPWSLIGSDDSNNGDIITGGGLHEPQYPGYDDPLRKGECVSGWITFEIPDGLKTIAAKYAPTDPNGKPLPYGKWSLLG